MKFNRKVYVIPQEKYDSMMERNEKIATDAQGRRAATAAIGSGAGPSPPLPLSGEVPKVAASSAAEGHLEEGGPPARHLNTATSGSSSSSPPSTGGDLLKDIRHKIDAELSEEWLRNKAMKIAYLLLAEDAVDYKKYYVDLLLHTQSSSFPPPYKHHKLYWLLLRRGVPLNLISNVKLRRILHYIKNKYSVEEEEEVLRSMKRKRGSESYSDRKRFEESETETKTSADIRGEKKTLKKNKRILRQWIKLTTK